MLVSLEEDYLAEPFLGVNLRLQRRGVADLQGYVALPLGL